MKRNARKQDTSDESTDTRREVRRLREMNAFKTNFINSAAHELSTPLTPIRIQLSMLRGGMRGPIPQDQRWALDVIDRNVERLHTLVRDLLEVARLESGRLPIDMRPSDLAEIVHEAVESYSGPAEAAGLKVEVQMEPDLVVVADRRRLVQVLYNLIGNAIKFTPSGGKLRVETRRANQEAIISVQDTGVGLREADMGQLFQAFSQIFNPDIGYAPGAGLGLYISRSIVELHGGRIWAHSAGPGKGSTFAFAVPLAARHDKAQPIVRSVTGAPTTETEFSRRIRELV